MGDDDDDDWTMSLSLFVVVDVDLVTGVDAVQHFDWLLASQAEEDDEKDERVSLEGLSLRGDELFCNGLTGCKERERKRKSETSATATTGGVGAAAPIVVAAGRVPERLQRDQLRGENRKNE